MSIDDKIREAIKKRNKLLEVTKWDVDTHPNIYALDKFLRKSGYRLIELIVHKETEIPEVIIEPIKKDHPLYPDIVHDLSDGNFYSKPVKSELLGASDLESLIQTYENSLSIVKYLDSIDLKKLEVSK